MTADPEQQLSNGFDAVFAEPAPASTIDVARLLADGRRQVFRRRAASALGAAAVVGLAALLAPSVVQGGTAKPSTTTAPAAPGYDPLTLNVSFGWLPPQLSQVWYQNDTTGTMSPTGERASATAPSGENGITGQFMVTTGVGPTGRPVSTAGMHDVGTINGHPAYWSTSVFTIPNSNVKNTSSELVFRSPSGQVYDASVGSLSEQDSLRIARSMVYTPTKVALPVQVSEMVDTPTLSTGDIQYSGGRLQEIQLGFSADPARAGGNSILLTMFPAQSNQSVDCGANFRQATKTVNGFKVTLALGNVASSSADPAAVTPTTDPATLFKYLKVLGPNPAQWTTAVFPPQ